MKLTNYRFCSKRWLLLCLFVISSFIGNAKETFWDHLEFGLGVGPTKFTGTVNMTGEFFSFYRTDGNNIGLAFAPEVRFHINDYLALDLHSSVANLSGNVTYNGDPTGTPVRVVSGTVRSYQTTVYNFIPMANVNVLNIINPGFNQDISMLIRGGVGLSYCDIQTLPFTPLDKLYDFGESSHWVVTVAAGFVLQKRLNNGWSCFGAFTFLASATSKVDAYYIDSKPVNEGLPSGNNEITKLPLAADSHAYLTLGVSYRIKAGSSVGGHRYKAKKMSRSRLRKRRKRSRSQWVK